MAWAGGVATLAVMLAVLLAMALSEIRRLRKTLGHLRTEVERDPLTGVLTRAAFDGRLAVAVARARRHDAPVALLVIELDDFARVVTVHSEAVIDRVRQTVAEHLVEMVRVEDSIGRLAANTFGLVLDGVRSADVAEQVASRLCTLLRGPVGDTDVSITASIGGVIGVPGPKEQLNDLERDAELALRVARRRGRGRYEIFDRIEDRVRRSA